MNAGTTFSVILSLVKDTFRQSMASGICWLLMGLSTIGILVCSSVSVEAPQRRPRRASPASFRVLIRMPRRCRS